MRLLARLTIWRYRPGIVGVTGSVGKTSTKLAIAAVLRHVRRVRVSSGNLNSELGLPLAILGDWSAEELKLVSRERRAGTALFRKFFFWCKVIFGVRVAGDRSNRRIIRTSLFWNTARTGRGTSKDLLKIARPNVSVITAVGDFPVHVEFYAGPAEVAREKGRLIECLPSAGFAVLNADDETVMGLEPRTRARVITYRIRKGRRDADRAI